MGDWQDWVAFISGEAANSYVGMAGTADNPANWHIQIGSKEGDFYAQSEGFPTQIAAADCKRLGIASTGSTDTDVFSAPPKGFTIVKAVDCDAVWVLAGKGKGEPAGRQLFVGYTTDCLVIGLADITNHNKTSEIKALDAFTHGLQKAMENGI